MSAGFGANEIILSLFLAGLFGVAGYFVGYGVSLRGRKGAVAGLGLVAVSLWAWIVFVVDYPHALAAHKALVLANATLWPLCIGAVIGVFITSGPAHPHGAEDRAL